MVLSTQCRPTTDHRPGTQLVRIVVSGATGTIGNELVRKLISETNAEIICLYLNSKAKARSLVELGIERQRKIKAIRCDLTQESEITTAAKHLVTDRIPNLTIAIHCAADVSWSRELSRMLKVNVEGSTNFCRLIQSSSANARLIYLSSAYTSSENWVYRNSYEESKAIAERAIKKNFSDLQISTFSSSLVMGDSTTGRISRFHGLYPLLKYLVLFDVPFLVGRPDCPLDLVPIDWVVDELFEMIDRTANGHKTEDVVASAGDCKLVVGDLLGAVYERINLFRKSNGLEEKTAPAIIPYRRWMFLRRSLDKWNVDSVSPQMISYFTELMETYRCYVDNENDNVLPPVNVTRPAPDSTGYLATVIDYWLQSHRKMILSNWQNQS